MTVAGHSAAHSVAMVATRGHVSSSSQGNTEPLMHGSWAPFVLIWCVAVFVTVLVILAKAIDDKEKKDE